MTRSNKRRVLNIKQRSTQKRKNHQEKRSVQNVTRWHCIAFILSWQIGRVAKYDFRGDEATKMTRIKSQEEKACEDPYPQICS